MPILTSPRGKVEVVHCRRTESQDICCIQKLIRKFTQKLFGNLNIIYLLEKANLAITLHNDREEIMAQATFVDYPNWNVAQQDDWVPVFRELDADIPCTPLNTLFMHLFVAVDEYSNGCCKEMLRTVFKAVPEVHFIFLIVPAYMSIGTTLINVFDLVGNVPSLEFDEDFSVHICYRQNHYPQLHIRKAKVEDHDDLMPILMRHDTVLRDTYGEYFLAELIEAQDEENQAAVCEALLDGTPGCFLNCGIIDPPHGQALRLLDLVEGRAVGFMNVCSEVNMQLLHECFDLGPFHGLCTPHPEDVLEPPKNIQLQENKDSEVKSGSDGSLKRVEKLQEPATSELMENIQEKIGNETELEELSPESQFEVNETEFRRVSSISSVDESDQPFSQPSLTPILMPDTSSFHPVYKGAASAFCIQLFCIDEQYEARSLDFMDFVFSLFPNKNFCIISLPHMTPEFPLIQYFVKIVPFNNCTLEQDLYVFHRAGLLKSINIRFATKLDCPGVENLVNTLMLSKRILEDVSSYTQAGKDPDGTPLQAFVADVADQIVGVAVTRDEKDIEYIRSHYNIEDFIYFSHHQRQEHVQLYHFALNPIFRHYSKFFLKEIFRLGFKSCLYYPIYQKHREGKFQGSLAHSLTSVLHYLVPVRPRRQIVYPLEKLGINAPSKSVSKELLGFALYHTNRKLTLEPKITVNAKIVVVGASNVAISFLETLVFCSHLKFSNLTLISTHGLPGKKLLQSEERKFLATDHCFNDKDHALMLLCSWVNVVVGRMTAIDRAAKHVVVSKDKIVLYDHLILCTGQQYQVPCPSGVDINLHLTNREIANPSKQRYTGIVPYNHFLLNDEEDCFEALTWIRNNSIIPEGKVIVYGNTLDTYTTVETLLHIGIKGCNIFLVQPPSLYTTTCFNNYFVDCAVNAALAAKGVTVYRDALLAQWNDGQNPDPIHCASFTTFNKPLKLSCSVFFSFCEKNVDYNTFKAFNDACLVYDGRLVIDTNFHTNDVAIRAAGSLTKFSNRYYSNEWTHSNFSSKEIGFQLAAAMLNLFDPTIEPVIDPPPELDRLIPMYKGAKIQGGILPGSFHYLHIAKPAIPTPLEVHRTQSDLGTEIVTGSANEGNYFRIHINKYRMVETITCLSKKPFPTSNYIRLFGQHEQVLNNLCGRFNDNMIPDLYSFFEESWSMAIFHDRFIDLRKELRHILISSEDKTPLSMERVAFQIEDEEITLNEKSRTYLKRVYEQSIYKSLVEKSILDYLHYNNYHLPMYAWSGII